MSDSPAWLCYGDYVCLSTCAGASESQQKYLLGHSSPLMQLQKLQNSKSDFASIILAENPATVPFTSEPSGKDHLLDLVTNAREYWFEILPQTDYDMSAQLGVFKKQLGDAKRRLQQFVEKQSQIAKTQTARQPAIIDKTPSTLDVALNTGADIHMSSQPPTDAVIASGDVTVTFEMQPMSADSSIITDAPDVSVKGTATAGRRKSVIGLSPIEEDIADMKFEIANLESRVVEYKTKMLQEQKGNAETITRVHGDALVFGALIQLRHVASKRLIAVSKQADRPVELAQHGRSGSLFYIERISTGVAGGSTKVPAEANISVRLRSFVSDSQFLRMEPNLQFVTGTKFPVSLDVELDGVFNADQCFQLGTGAAAPGDNRVEWIIERCKHNSVAADDSSEADADGDDAEDDDDGVDVSEVLSGCQIIRLFHRASESYICAVPSKVDRGKVFFSHRSESDPSKGSGKVANSYWMVIDGDGDMENSGEDVKTDNAVILQHVVSGMVLVAIRHLPAIDSNRATYDEEYLSDEDDSAADGQAEEKLIITKRNKLEAWIETFLKAIEDALDYCSNPIQRDLTITKFLAENDISDDVFGEQQQPVLADEDTFDDDMEFDEPQGKGGKGVRFDQWKESAGSVKACLKEAEAFLLKINDLTVQSIHDKSVEIEHEVEDWLKSPIYRSPSGRRFTATEVVDTILGSSIQGTNVSLDEGWKGDWESESGQSQSGRSQSGRTLGGYSARPPTEIGQSQGHHQPASTAQTFRDGSSVLGTQLDDSASLIMRHTKSAISNLHMLENYTKKFKRRDQKDKKSEGPENPWTFHVMSPKRILSYRKRLADTFTSITLKEKKEPFLISCRWSLSTKHEKVRRKEGETSITNTTLFGLEVFDLSKDQLFLIGSQQGKANSETDSSKSSSKSKRKDLAIIPLGRLASGKGLEPQLQSQMESQLFNVEFVSLKSADQIRNGSQVSSIIRNFCSQLSAATEKRELDTYIAFLRRYHSRLTEAFDVVARSCVHDGFQKDCNVNLADVDRQGQLFFGSLGIIELAFSVIQPLTEQLGWQIEEEPPFFTSWKVRLHWAPVLHYALSAISATTTLVPPSKADEFFKLWRQRKDDTGRPFGDDKMFDMSEYAQHEKLEEMGFPPLHDDKGQVQPRVAHNLFRFFAIVRKIREERKLDSVKWEQSFSELDSRSPRQYAENLMKQNFPNLDGSGLNKKMRDVERFFNQAFTAAADDGETVDQDDGAYKKNDELFDVLEYGMKPSDLDYFMSKYVKEAGLVVFKAAIAPALASRIRKMVADDDTDSSLIDVPAGQQTFCLSEYEFSKFFKDGQLSEIKDPSGNTPSVPPWLAGVPSPPFIKKELQLKKAFLKWDSFVSFEHCVSRMHFDSQKNLAKILKNVALDVDNFDSPWNTLPITFNFKDPVRYGEIRAILIEVIRKSLTCLTLLCKYCNQNQKKITGSQVYYLIKNLFPKSPANQLNIGSVLKHTLQGNFSVVDRMYTDAVYSSLLGIMNDVRTPAVPQVLESLMVKFDGAADYGQQMRVLKYAFKIPYSNGQVLIPRLSVVRKNGGIDSLRLVLDSTFALNKQKNKPNPKDHPFAYIKPPHWAKSADGERRLYIEPWDVCMTPTLRTGFLAKRYGEWCPVTSFNLKALSQEYDVLQDFGYFSNLQAIEKRWEAVHMDKSLDAKALISIERDLKRDWWYCTMLLHLQYLCACYSLVAKLCSNRNIQAWNFFFDKQKQTKNEFFVQTWGSRPQESIIKHEGDLFEETETHNTYVNFDTDSFSTVAAVSNIKPMNPSCAFENQFPTRKFMYYEVTIESEPDDKSMLQIGWTIASRERNGDHASDGDGTGDFPHSWGFDGIRSISYNSADNLLKSYNKTISEQQINLATLIPTAKDLIETQIQDIQQNRKSQIDFAEINRLWSELSDSMQKSGQDEKDISKIRKEVENAKFLLRTRISLRRNMIAQMNGAKKKYDKDTSSKKANLEEWKKNPNVDRGLLCFHTCNPDLPDCSAAYLSDEIEKDLNSENPESYGWTQKSVIGVWLDMDSLEMGIVRSGDHGGKQTLLRRSDTAFFDDINDVRWKEADIVPCISGRGVDIKINLGILEGVSNDFKYFDEEKIVFRNIKDLPTSLFSVTSVKGGKFSTPQAIPLKSNQFIRLKFPPKISLKPEPKLKDGVYTCANHGLEHKQFVHFVEQVSYNDIEEGTSYIVELEDGNTDEFRLVKCNLKEKEPYRIKFDKSDPKQFELVFSASNTDELYCSDPILHPRVFLKGEVDRADWGPYGETPVDVTQIYNDLYQSGLRQFGNIEAIYADGTKKVLSAGLKDLFKPKDAHGNVLFEGVACYLRVFRSVVISDTDNLNIQCAACLGFVPPTRVSAIEIANFAFADGKPVIPDYHLLSDIVFCSSLPSSLRASCVELLRSCFIDQEPWFLTPPINTIRAIQQEGRIAPPAVKKPGAYLASKMNQFGYNHRIPSKGFGQEYCCYDESDLTFFDDLFNAAAWNQSQNKNPVDFGNKNWDDDLYKDRKEFLLGGFKYPSQSFQLCTRDIAVFWGRVTSQLWEKGLKDRFISQKNQDCKIFLKNLVYCLLDTLKFEFDESWTGIIAVRSKVVHDLELCILSYFQQTEIAQMVADVVKKRADARSSNVPIATNESSPSSMLLSCSSPSSMLLSCSSPSSILLSCFRRRDTQTLAQIVVDASDDVSDDISHYTSRVPEEIRQAALYVDEKLLREFAQLEPPMRKDLAIANEVWMTLDKDGEVVKSRSSKLLTSRSDVLIKEAEMLDRYTKYSVQQGNSRGKLEPYGYFEWISGIESKSRDQGQYSHDELKTIFKEASGDLLLSLCKLLEVSWQVMIDDKISDFIQHCNSYHGQSKTGSDSLSKNSTDNAAATRQLQLRANEADILRQYRASEAELFRRVLRDFFEKEKSNETKLPCEYVDEHGQLISKSIDWFDVIPCLATIPKTEVRNMASKLCIQLHSFPKDLFQKIKQTEIVAGQESEVLNALERELRLLRAAKDSIRLCFFSEEDMLEVFEIPNEASCSLGKAWLSVERLIAQLSKKEIYEKSLAAVQSWVDPSVARIFVPLNENDPKYDKAMEKIDDSGGMPCWEESLEFIDMLQEALADESFCPLDERNWIDEPSRSPYIIIPAILDEEGYQSWPEMQVFSSKLDVQNKKDDDNAPAVKEYSCAVCNKDGCGYCFCFYDKEQFEIRQQELIDSGSQETAVPDWIFVHPKCVYDLSIAGPSSNLFQDPPPVIPLEIEARYRDIYESNLTDQEVSWATERKSFVIEQVKDSIATELFLDHGIQDGDAAAKNEDKKIEQLKKAMVQIGIIDQLMEIVMIPFPRKYTLEEADSYNQKMQRRMKARRINYLFEKASATYDRVTIVDNLFRRIFGLLAIAATSYSDIQNRLYDDIDFLFTKALEPTANDSALCIYKTIEGKLDLAQDVSIDLLMSMVKVAQDGQNPDDILLLIPFMAQGDKNVSINQREILELCLPTAYSHTDDCMFVLDSDYPSESVDRASYESWKKNLVSCHVPKAKANFGEHPWTKEHNWKHLLRVSCDIAHGGFASKSEPCRSAFHIAFIQTLISCAFKNAEERQNIILRLPFDQVLHILNTVCRTLFHRIWGHSFVNRVKLLSGDPQFADMSTTPFDRDPRFNFLNFDTLRTATATSSEKPLEMLPLLGVIKFVNVYMNLVFNVHFFSESGTDDIVRRTPEGLPLTATADKTQGFIEWMGIILKHVICVFSFKNSREIREADPGQEGSTAGVLATLDHSSRRVSLSSSSFVARPFKDIDEEWYRANGDVSVEDFDGEVSHHLISISLNQMWTRVFGLEVDYETKSMQGLKMSDVVAFDSRTKDIHVSKKFCRPFWRCPISHHHFTNENFSLLALAVSSILFDSVPMEWKSKSAKKFEAEKKPSILGAIRNTPMGYVANTGGGPAFRPNSDDIAEAQLFVLAIELVIQEMHADRSAKGLNAEIKPTHVLERFTERKYYTTIRSSMKSFQSHWHEFEKYFQTDKPDASWPIKLAQSSNETSAIIFIEKKITQWNIIYLFNAPRTDANQLYKRFSAIQRPVIRRCLTFALVYNWGGWAGLGSEMALTTVTEITDSIGFALKDICQITLDTFPSFIQQFFQRFEAPKAGSSDALEYKKIGEAFLGLSAALQKDQGSSISKICTQKRDTHNSTPLDYLKHVGSMLQNAPSTWSSIDAYTKPRYKASAVVEAFRAPSSPSADGSKSRPTTAIAVISHEEAAARFLTEKKVEDVIRTTIDDNEEDLLYRFLAIDTADRLNPVDPEYLPFSFYSKRELISSTDRNLFPPYLSKMVYNILNVLSSSHRMPRGEDTNAFLHTCLRAIIQIIFAGACVDLDEASHQFAKLSKNKLVMDQQDSDSLFARIGHLQECLVGLRWLSNEELESTKGKIQQNIGQNSHLTIVTHPSYKVAVKSFQSIAKLITQAAPTVEIRTQALLALSCMLDHCSTAVLDRFFDPKDTQVIHSPSNSFARSLQYYIKMYEDFQDRDDDLTISLQKFKAAEKLLADGALRKIGGGSTDDEFIRRIIEFETTDWIGESLDAREQKREPKLPDPIIKEAYEQFSSKGFTTCLYTLRLINQMCVQSGKMSRASYAAGQKYMILQPNSDPALAVDFPSAINSLGSAIASRMRLGQANVFDIRVLCRLFKALNSIVFGLSSSETKDFLVAETYVLINKTVSGLSQRIDDTAAPFFPGNHPVHVLEQMLMFLLSFALSDINGKSCQALSKGTSWINFFNLISQVQSTSTKYFAAAASSSGETKSSQISPQEYRSIAFRICDSAYILYSAVKRRDISRSAQLEKDWNHAHLEAVALDAQRRVSCVEIVRTPGFAELCFFTNPDHLGEVGDNTQTTLLCLEDSRQLSLRKNLVICEQLRNRKISSSGVVARVFKILRNVPLVLTTLINLLLLGWLNLPIDFSEADKGWKWPQEELSWKYLVPNITTEDGSYTYEEFQSDLLPNVLPLFISNETPEGIIYRNGVNMTFLLLAGTNIFACFVLLVGWLLRNASIEVYEYLLTSAYNEFLSPSNKSKKKISLEDLQTRAGGSSFFMILRIPAFWGRLVMFVCSLCILLVSPLFSVLFVCDGFRFPGISYIFGAFTAKGKEFLTLGYLTASIIFMNAVIGLVFFWDLFGKGENESGSSECTSLFQCTLSFIVLGWQGGGLSDLLTAAKDTPQGTPFQIGSPKPESYRLIIALFWQLLYFIVVPTCLVSTVVGIISDSFGDARQKKSEWKDTMSQNCFVCGRTAADFRDAGLVAGLPPECIVSFEEHVTTEHCVKDYFKLFMGVKGFKNPDLLTAQEHYVLQKINSLDESFFPMDLSISLDAMKSFAESESSAAGAEKQDKRMDTVDQEIGKLATTLKEVMEMLGEIKKNQDERNPT